MELLVVTLDDRSLTVQVSHAGLVLCCDARWRLSLPWVQMLRHNAGSRLSFSVQTRDFQWDLGLVAGTASRGYFNPGLWRTGWPVFDWWQGTPSMQPEFPAPWNSEWADHITCCATTFKYHALLQVFPQMQQTNPQHNCNWMLNRNTDSL